MTHTPAPTLNDTEAPVPSTKTLNSHPLLGLFEPQSIAILGASSDPYKLGGRPIRFLRDGGFKGRVYPVNSKSAEIQGYKAYASVKDLPEVVDQAIIILPASACEQALLDCAEKGIKVVQVFSSGFAEEGEAGLTAQLRLVEIAQANKMQLLGPNCLGVVGAKAKFFASFSTALEALVPQPGNIAIATQSGAFGSCAYSMAIQRGMGLSRIVATGNEAHIDVAQCIDFLADDPDTLVICAAIEGCRDGNRLRQALVKAAQNCKSVVMMKVGVSAIGVSAAATHTGSLAGNDAIYDTIFEECGAWRAKTIEEMLDVAYFCSKLPEPVNNRAGIITVSGGIGILMADDAERCQIALPPLPAPVAAKMSALLPFAPIANPMDTTAQVTAVKDGVARSIDILLGGTDWSSLLLYMAQSACAPLRFEPLRQSLIALKQQYPERRFILIGPSDEKVRYGLEAEGFVVLSDPSRALLAAQAQMVITQRRASVHLPRKSIPKTQALLDASNEAQAKNILQQHGIPVLPEKICRTRTEAMQAAASLGFPVVLKILSPDILHKTEIGGVLLNLQTSQAVGEAFDMLMQRATSACPDARIEGVLIAPMASEGIETILGIHSDPVFGPMVMFGLGGIAVELFKDVAFASAPINLTQASALIKKVKSSTLLEGWRGQAAHDTSALAQALVNLSEFAFKYSDTIQSVDINPFLVKQQGAVCLDAVITLAP